MPSVVWAQVTPPYLETFDAQTNCTPSCSTICNMSNGWVNATGDGLDWLVHSGSTSSASTGPTGDHTSGAGKYLYIESSSPCSPNVEGQLVSPDIDLTMGNATQLEFWYHMFGAAQGTLHVDIDPDGGGDGPWTLDVVPALTDNMNLWQLQVVDLTPYVGTTINVRFRGITGTSFTSDMAIDDVRLFNLWGDDLGATSVDGLDGCGLGMNEPITVTLTNHGANAQTMFDVSYSIDGAPPVVETYMGTLAPLATTSFTFATTADLSGPGPFDITVATILAGDQDPSNDSVFRQVIPIGNTVTSYPHFNDFEAGMGDWYSYGTNNTWAFGTPAKSIIQGAASGVNAWVNGGLTGTYNNSESSSVETLCGFDLSTVMFPAVRFRAWWDTETSFDRVYFEASTDGGGTWQVVGAFGDPVNWYNISGGGWTGTINQYMTVAHELQAYAGNPSVRFRVRFSSDGSVVRNGFAFDDFEIFENLPQLTVSDASPPPPASAIAPGVTDLLVQTVRLNASGNLPISVDALTFTLTGSLPETDIVNVTAWLDNGDGVFSNVSDSPLTIGQFSGGTVTFAGLSGPVTIGALESKYIHISFDLSANALPGASFGTTLAVETDVVPVGMIPVVFSTTPVDGPILTLLDKIATLPWTENYDGVPAVNRIAQVAANLFYPIASGPGPVVDTSPSPSPNPGVAEILDQAPDGAGGFITPFSSPYMGAFHFPNGGAAAAFDYWFDLSGYSVEDDLLYLGFWWNNTNMNDHDLNNVFVSVDAATTWAASVHRWNFEPTVPPGWNYSFVDVSSRVKASGSDFSSSTVIRFQAFGLLDFGQDGLLIDDLWLGIPQYARVERVPGVYLPSGSVDGVNGMGTGPITLTYTVTNASHVPLDILGDVMVTNVMGASNITVSPATLPAVLDIDESTTFQVSFNADVEYFRFDLEFLTNDPRAENGLYTLAVIGEHGPRLAVERLPNVTLPSGITDDLGQFAEGEWTVEYTIFNRGTVDMNLLGMPDPVVLSNLSNVTAEITQQPVVSVLPPGAQETFVITFTGDPAADFSFDMGIQTDDPDNANYTLTLVGHTFADVPDAGPTPDAMPMEPDAGMEPPIEDDGCSCEVGGAPRTPPLAPFALVLLGFAGLYIRHRVRPRRAARRSARHG